MPPVIEGYLIGYTSSDEACGIDISSQHKATETRQIDWTTKTITPLGTTTIEPLLAEETYTTAYPLSCPLLTIKVEKETDQDRKRQINPPTFKYLALPQNIFSETPDPPAISLLALPEEQ